MSLCTFFLLLLISIFLCLWILALCSNIAKFFKKEKFKPIGFLEESILFSVWLEYSTDV